MLFVLLPFVGGTGGFSPLFAAKFVYVGADPCVCPDERVTGEHTGSPLLKVEKDLQYKRRSIRLKNYDYSQRGAYFITICAQNKELFFEAETVREMIKKWWKKIETEFSGIQNDAFVIMPNHVHGIIVNVGADPRVCPDERSKSEHTGSPLPKIVQWFKTMTTNEYIRGVKKEKWKSFNKRLWQRNYYEHIIRDENSLERIREYIINNPLKWHLDRENPYRVGEDEFDCRFDGLKTSPEGVFRK